MTHSTDTNNVYGDSGADMGDLESPELHSQSKGFKSLPLVKIKRVKGGNRAMYRVYKWVKGNYKIKRTFYTLHQAHRYVKGMGAEANQKVAHNNNNLPKQSLKGDR